MSNPTVLTPEQIKDAELRIPVKALLTQVDKLCGLVSDFLQMYSWRERERILSGENAALSVLLKQAQESSTIVHKPILSQGTSFHTPKLTKLEQLFVNKIETLPIDEHWKVIEKINAGIDPEIPKLPKKKKKASK